MPIIDETGRKSPRIRFLLLAMYLTLALLGVTMAYPFLITLTASTSNSLDYYRFSPAPRSLWSREDRFVRGLVSYFPETMRGGMEQFSLFFRTAPAHWTTWKAAGDDIRGINEFARLYLDAAADPARWLQIQQTAADYARFAHRYPLDDSMCAYNERHVGAFLRDYYMDLARQELGPDAASGLVEKKALDLIGRKWGYPITSFYIIRPGRAYQVPWEQPSFCPFNDGRDRDFDLLRQAYRERRFIPSAVKAKWGAMLRDPGVREVLGWSGSGSLTLTEINQAWGTSYRSWNELPFPVTEKNHADLRRLWDLYLGTVFPVCETRPVPLKPAWFKFLGGTAAQTIMGGKPGVPITIEEYNRAFGTRFAALQDTPFPVPTEAPPKLRQAWELYVQTQYPLRLIEVKMTPELTRIYQDFVRNRFRDNLARGNQILGTTLTDWSGLELPNRMPAGQLAQANLWMEFVATRPFAEKIPRGAESAYQSFLLQQYGSVSEINRRYGLKLGMIEQAEMPFNLAYLVTFIQNEGALYRASLTENYGFVLDYLVLRGRAVGNTLILIVLSLFAALTVNPLAAYALSRFRMRQTSAIILFLLSTMAFPAAVTMIPGFLLMRDLHMLNTYAALILPGVANGMSIFLLKGFFDSLPQELYEAAALDGMPEWMVFLKITLPLSMPILAVIALNCFIAAYNSWEWALVVCQKQEMWTLAVWLYQFNATWYSQPWAVMASFVVASIPVFLVFLLCQNIILRGIVLPQMK